MAFGGQLRALHIGRALKQVGDVTLLVVNSTEASKSTISESGEEFSLSSPAIATPTAAGGLGSKLRRAFDSRYMDLHGCAISQADQERINAEIDRHDLVWVFNSRTPNLVQRWQWPRTHLDIDDLPSAYQRTVASSERNLLLRWKARLQQSLLYRRERDYARRFTTLSVCSNEDRVYLNDLEQLHVIPNGFERPAIPPTPRPIEPPRIGFIGLYSYAPNLEGVRWFLQTCWPELRATVPGMRFRIIGKDSDGLLKPTEDGVDALGWLKDPASEIASWSLMVIPIRSGGGTRIKIADAFSRKCAVVSTRVGAFGYPVVDGRQLRLADTPAEFVRACLGILRDPPEAAAMAERAWQDFTAQWTWDAIAPKVWAAAEDCLRRSHTTDV